MQGNVNVSTNENDIVVVLGNEKNIPEKYSDSSLVSVKYVHSDLNDLQHSYIRLGFHLHEIQKFRYFEQFGYYDFYNFCAANFGLDRTSVSRLLDVSRTFCMRKPERPYLQTMFIDETYKDYSYSQLCEMLPLSLDQRKQIKPNMTVKQIREFKKRFKKKSDVHRSPDYSIFSDYCWTLLIDYIGKFFTSKGFAFKNATSVFGICKKFSFSCDDKEYEILFRVRQQK